jgi:hypothetical protein
VVGAGREKRLWRQWLRLFFEPNSDLAEAILQAKPFHVLYRTFSTPVTIHTYLPTKMEQTQCFEMLAFNPYPANVEYRVSS